MQRVNQLVSGASILAISWLLMQAVHEAGHAVAARLTGGHVVRVVLHPLTISRTDVEPNPRPLVVAWGGSILGVSIPLAFFLATSALYVPARLLTRFFAGFCLLANGLYLGIGSLADIGDAGDLVRHGAPRWTLWLFGIATAPAGLALWNGIGPLFGYGPSSQPIRSMTAVCAAAVLLILAALEWTLSSP